MVTITQRVDRMNFAPFAAVLFGVAAAILIAAVPVSMFESAVMATGLPQAVSIAAPPLGLKARIFAVVLAFLVVGALAWAIATPIERMLDRNRRRRTPWSDAGYAGIEIDGTELPVDRARRPISAGELGAPLMSDAALASVAPIAPFESDPELEAPVSEEDLLPIPDNADAWTPTTPADGETSIHALIRRLEAGLAKRGGSDDPDPGAPAAGAPLTLEDAWIVERSPSRARDDNDLGAALETLKRFAWR